jgi:hypothetical protein
MYMGTLSRITTAITQLVSRVPAISSYIRYWHKAGIPEPSINIRF